MFAVELDRENLEYDVHSLVQAFYPGEQVRVLIPESSAEKRAQLQDKVRIRVRMDRSGAKVTIDGREYAWEGPDWSEGKGETGEVSSGEQKAPDASKKFKDGFKSFLYRTLCQVTGRELPWGSLTGIRPTKIAYQLLEEGKSPREILAYYKDKYFVSQEKAELSVDIAQRERELLAGLGAGAAREGLPQREGGSGDGKADAQSCSEGDVRSCREGYSLYIGIPFCPTTCLYCSFTSFPIGGYRSLVEPYIDCLIREIRHAAELMEGRRLDCVYIGGGTPTTLEAGQLDRRLTALRESFDFRDVREFTVEAGRADSITEEKLQVLHSHGVGRISVNPQTMRQRTLDVIGRKATVEQVEEAYRLARKAGFCNINMDLILGLPGELEEDVRFTIDRVVELAPDSLTVHSLAVKRASGLNRMIQEKGMPMLRNTEETMRIAAEGAKKLGLVPYYLYRQKNMSGNFENVGYAREGKLGLYNILIMEEIQTIMAVGAGSISKRVYPDGRIERCENVKDVAQYMERIHEMIDRKERLMK